VTNDGNQARHRGPVDPTRSRRSLRPSRAGALRSSGAGSADGRPEPPAAAGLADLDAATIDCAVYDASGRLAGPVNVTEARARARVTGGFVWIGLREPTTEQFASLAAAFDLPPLAVEDAVRAHQRPKLDVYDDVAFVVLKPVRYVDSEEIVEISEIALFVGPDFVVTVRHGRSDVLAAARAELDDNDRELLSHGPTAVLYRVADLVVDQYEEVAAAISLDVDEIEAQVFGGDGRDHAERIYKLKREVIEFRRAVIPLEVPVRRLAEAGVPALRGEAAPYFRDVHDHLLRAADAIEGHDKMLTDVLTADLAQVTVRQNRAAVRQNEDMRKISAWAAIALVPTAIAGIYGMNFEHMPELGWKYGYFMVLAVIAAACTGLYYLFRRNGWL
jgi:magnesium transporter